MPNKIYLAVIAALTISLLVIPLVASATDANDQLDSHRINFGEGTSGGTGAVDEKAHFAIYVESEMNVMDEMLFIEDNLPGIGHDYVIDIVFPAQPQGEVDMTRPAGISETEWIQFLEANSWDYDPNADVAGEADLPTLEPGFCEVVGSGCVDGEPTADIAGETDVESFQGEGYVDTVNRTLNPY